MKVITDFMMSIHDRLVKEKGVTESTATKYIRDLYNLNNERPFKNLAWLKNTESVHAHLADYAETTQKTLMSVIVSVLGLVKDKQSYKKIHAYWYTAMMDKSNALKSRDPNVKTAKQEENWLSWDVVQAHESRLKGEVEALKGKELNSSQWDTLLSFMVLSLYTRFAPRRNQDYMFMKLVGDEKKATEADSNYLVLGKMPKFIFRKYKTSKKHGEQVFDLPIELVDALTLYLNAHPLLTKSAKLPLAKKVGVKSDGIPFLVHHDGTPLTAVNSITRILNKIFGKRIGATALRHIYLSSKYDVQEMNEDAEKMAHGSNQQREYMKVETGGSVSSVDIPMLQG